MTTRTGLHQHISYMDTGCAGQHEHGHGLREFLRVHMLVFAFRTQDNVCRWHWRRCCRMSQIRLCSATVTAAACRPSVNSFGNMLTRDIIYMELSNG